MTSAFVAYLHYLSIFVLFALLSIEHVQFKLPLDIGSVDVSFATAPEPVLARGKARDAKFSQLNEPSRNAASR